MINLNFKNWFLNEVTFSGGKYAGKDHFNVPTFYLLYLAVKFFNGENINYYSEQDIEDILNEIQRRKDIGNPQAIPNNDHKEFYNDFDSELFNIIMDKVKAVKGPKPSVSVPPVTPRAMPAPPSVSAPVISAAPVPDSREWFLAKVIEDYAGMGKGTFVAVSKSMVDPTNFEYIKVDDPSISGIIPLAIAKRHLASERKENGEVVKINKPKEGVIDPATRLKTAMSQHTKDDIKEKETEEKTGKYILQKLDAPENAEQKAIDERFAQILRTGEKSHIILNALAGSGKTTILNHLAWKYGRPGQKWLYLVFNKKNRHEASTKFPSWVDVQTTNSFLGTKVLGMTTNKRIVGGTEIASRVAGKTNIEKLTMLADTVACSNFIKSLNLPDVKLATPKETTYISYGRRTTKSYPTEGYVKQYLNAIKRDAVKMTEIAKAYALDPREKDCEQKIKEIMNKNFWANQRRTMVMKGFLDKGKFYEDVIKLGLIDSRPTKISESEWEKNDKDATYKISMWLLKNSLPGEKLEIIDIGGRKVNLGALRDFADDLWFTSLFASEIHWPKYDVILADEVQDFSESQKIMLNKLAEQGAIVVAVGDPAQSIYKFRGADHLAFNNLKEMLTGISEDKNVEKTLTRNFRSKKAILDFVNDTTVVNNLKVGKKYDPSEEGEVTTNKYNTKDSIELISKERLANKADPKNKILQTAFISRSGLPISAIAGRLMEKSIPYVIFGYDAVDDVKKAVYKYCGGKEKINGVPIYELPDLIGKYYDKVIDKYAGKAAANKVLEEERKTSSLINDTLQAFDRSVGYENTVGGYLKWMENICGGINVEDMTEEEKEKLDKKLEDKGVVVLTTAHRSKGFEFDRVFILNPGMFGAKPKKRDPEISDEAHDSDNIQEDNMKYVAYTRAIDQLHLMKKDEDEEVEKKASMEDEEAGDGVNIDLL